MPEEDNSFWETVIWWTPLHCADEIVQHQCAEIVKVARLKCTINFDPAQERNIRAGAPYKADLGMGLDGAVGHQQWLLPPPDHGFDL